MLNKNLDLQTNRVFFLVSLPTKLTLCEFWCLVRCGLIGLTSACTIVTLEYLCQSEGNYITRCSKSSKFVNYFKQIVSRVEDIYSNANGVGVYKFYLVTSP